MSSCRNVALGTCLVLRDHRPRGLDEEAHPCVLLLTTRVSSNALEPSFAHFTHVIHSLEGLGIICEDVPHLQQLDE